jgi:hypothetical protein
MGLIGMQMATVDQLLDQLIFHRGHRPPGLVDAPIDRADTQIQTQPIVQELLDPGPGQAQGQTHDQARQHRPHQVVLGQRHAPFGFRRASSRLGRGHVPTPAARLTVEMFAVAQRQAGGIGRTHLDIDDIESGGCSKRRRCTQ